MQNARHGINAKNPWRIGIIMFGGCLLMLLGMDGMAVAQTAEGAGSPEVKALPVVYVADFQLEVEAEDKAIQRPFQVRKRIKDRVDLATGEESPEKKAKEIVDTLAESIVAELSGKGVVSKRLYKQPPPAFQCWVLEGEFVERDEGDRLKRAVIGFGSGSTDMQVGITLSDIADKTVKVLLDTQMDGRKDRMPGAVVTRNPYVAGAKFILTKNAPDRDVKKLGSQIADRIYEVMKGEGLVKQ
ncbi:MAG: DUF4410 domain-containing protein [Syntrophorhabdaceae bacterium]|nr:DUF4410 domain-containing protein [Syntrophorhabdaceae bacterium]